MIVTDDQLSRFRTFAAEPVREPMGVMIGGPTAQGRFVKQAQQISQMRDVIREMLAIIEAGYYAARAGDWEREI